MLLCLLLLPPSLSSKEQSVALDLLFNMISALVSKAQDEGASTFGE